MKKYDKNLEKAAEDLNYIKRRLDEKINRIDETLSKIDEIQNRINKLQNKITELQKNKPIIPEIIDPLKIKSK